MVPKMNRLSSLKRRACCLMLLATALPLSAEVPVVLNRQDTGYRGIWYMNQPSGDEYVFKYSGGLGTYCAKHRPFAIHRPEVNKTFFVYGGTPEGSHLRHSEDEVLNGQEVDQAHILDVVTGGGR